MGSDETESLPTTAGPFTWTVTPSYIQLKTINVGMPRIRDGSIAPGAVTVTLEHDPEFNVQGTLTRQGVLSGMAKLHYRLALRPGDVLSFSLPRPGREPLIVVHALSDGRGGAGAQPPPPIAAIQADRVFVRMKLKHIHIEPFRPEALESWEPETETDVYLAFGVLQEYTDFRYCCGASSAILTKLGASYGTAAKPDAILIHRVTDEYLMAEWKMKSSAFKTNHSPQDVDVLVCWNDDETNRATLPDTVVSLYEVARTAATEAISGT